MEVIAVAILASMAAHAASSGAPGPRSSRWTYEGPEERPEGRRTLPEPPPTGRLLAALTGAGASYRSSRDVDNVLSRPEDGRTPDTNVDDMARTASRSRASPGSNRREMEQGHPEAEATVPIPPNVAAAMATEAHLRSVGGTWNRNRHEFENGSRTPPCVAGGLCGSTIPLSPVESARHLGRGGVREDHASESCAEADLSVRRFVPETGPCRQWRGDATHMDRRREPPAAPDRALPGSRDMRLVSRHDNRASRGSRKVVAEECSRAQMPSGGFGADVETRGEWVSGRGRASVQQRTTPAAALRARDPTSAARGCEASALRREERRSFARSSGLPCGRPEGPRAGLRNGLRTSTHAVDYRRKDRAFAGVSGPPRAIDSGPSTRPDACGVRASAQWGRAEGHVSREWAPNSSRACAVERPGTCREGRSGAFEARTRCITESTASVRTPRFPVNRTAERDRRVTDRSRALDAAREAPTRAPAHVGVASRAPELARGERGAPEVEARVSCAGPHRAAKAPQRVRTCDRAFSGARLDVRDRRLPLPRGTSRAGLGGSPQQLAPIPSARQDGRCTTQQRSCSAARTIESASSVMPPSRVAARVEVPSRRPEPVQRWGQPGAGGERCRERPRLEHDPERSRMGSRSDDLLGARIANSAGRSSLNAPRPPAAAREGVDRTHLAEWAEASRMF